MRPGNDVALDLLELRVRLFRGELLISTRLLKHLTARCDATKGAARRHRFDIGIEQRFRRIEIMRDDSLDELTCVGEPHRVSVSLCAAYDPIMALPASSSGETRVARCDGEYADRARAAGRTSLDSVMPVANQGASGDGGPHSCACTGCPRPHAGGHVSWRRWRALGPVELLDVPRSLKPCEVAAWLAGRIEELGRPVDLAGHSLGAMVSVRVAALRPDLVRRLVLISPPGVGPPRSPLAYAWPLARTMLGARPSFLVRLTYDGLRPVRGTSLVAACTWRARTLRPS